MSRSGDGCIANSLDLIDPCLLSLGFLGTAALVRMERISQNLYSQSHTLWRAACVELGITLAEETCTGNLRKLHHIASRIEGEAWTLEGDSAKRFIERGLLAMNTSPMGCGKGVRVSFQAWPHEARQLEWLLDHLQTTPLDADCLTSDFELHFETNETGVKMSPETWNGATLDLEGSAEMSFYWENQCLTCCVGVSLIPVHNICLTPENIDFCERLHFSLFPIDEECPPAGIDIPDSSTKGLWAECGADASGHLEITGTMLSVVRSLLSGKPVRALLMYRGVSDCDDDYRNSETSDDEMSE